MLDLGEINRSQENTLDERSERKNESKNQPKKKSKSKNADGRKILQSTQIESRGEINDLIAADADIDVRLMDTRREHVQYSLHILFRHPVHTETLG
jgi:hypothetical protein